MAKAVSALAAATLAGVAILTDNPFAAGGAAVLVVLTYAWSPRGYSLEGSTLLIHRLIGSVRIPLEGASEVRAATADDMSGAIRLFASGGMFGYYGLFQTTKLGRSSWYLTNRSKAVVLVTRAKTVLVSPDDVEGFLAAVRAVASVGPTGGAAPVRASRVGGVGPLVLGVGIAAVALAIVAFALLYSPGPPSYTLTAQSLTIHDRFYPFTVQAADVDPGQVRVIDLDADTGWRPAARTNGFANRHYHSGQFRTTNGRTVRLYQEDGKRLVLIPQKGEGAPVLLQTADPDQSAAEIRRQWTRLSP